jgi:hypothetical protein
MPVEMVPSDAGGDRTGVHFLFLRPAMLPEDLRFTGMEPRLLPPEMVEWLQIVFRTWGGFMAGFGLLMSSVAGYLLTSRIALLKLGTSLALLVALGRFLASNVLIHSDYLWFVAALFAVAVLVSLLFLLSLLRPSAILSDHRPQIGAKINCPDAQMLVSNAMWIGRDRRHAPPANARRSL